jgi:YesN/AraC family two-component response regulator
MTNPAPKLNVLLVDDDPAIVRLVSQVLQTHFADRISLAGQTDSNSAMVWLDHNCCDLLLSDISMPGIDGLELLKVAKRRNAWTQVIFLTAHSTWERIDQAIESGASDYLLKPIDRRELIMLVEQVAARCARWRSAVAETLVQST